MAELEPVIAWARWVMGGDRDLDDALSAFMAGYAAGQEDARA